MIIKGLDDKTYKINLGNYTFDKNKNRSNLCNRALLAIKALYPSDPICEEIYLPGANFRIYLDLYLPKRNLALEVDGEQHTKFNSFHYKDKMSFLKAKRRDREKEDLLELNNITLIRLPWNESIPQWRDRILSRFRDGPGQDSEAPG